MSFRCLVSVEQLAVRATSPGLVVFDCSFDLGNPAGGSHAYAGGHLPNARYLHLDDDLAGPPSGRNGRHPLPDPQVLAATLRAQGLDRADQVVAYDASGGPFAARLWWLLRWLGHTAVAVLDGGRQAWVAAGLPLEEGVPALAVPGDFAAATANAAMTVDAEAVLASIGDNQSRILDARTSSRFRGEANPLDAIPGRIPGARSRFYGDNLTDGGVFKPAHQLADDFGRVLDGAKPEDAILQCGSGVTACHNALAMESAGLRGARLYPGSWSEWIADPARPVERDHRSA